MSSCNIHLFRFYVIMCINSRRYVNTANKGDFMDLKKTFLETMLIVIGTFIMAVGISQFLLPNQLSSGGIAGIATITYYLFHVPMGTMILLINIPLFCLSFYKIGKSFFIKSMIGTITLSVFIDFFDQFEPLTNDRFLACIYGGIIIGLRYCDYLKSKFFYWRNGFN